MLGLKGWGRTAFALAAVLAGCGGNVTVPRGFGSRELLPLRDSTINLSYVTDVQGQDPVLVYTTQGDDASSTYWSLDLATGALQNDGDQAPGTTPVGPTGSGRYSCQYVYSDTTTIEVTDSVTGLSTNVEGVTGYAGCPDDDGFLAILRVDPDNKQDLTFWSGPYQQLAQISLPIEVRRIVIFIASSNSGADGGASGPSGALVVGAVPGQPDGLGIYSIDLASAQVTNIVPATPANAAWAPGAEQAGSLQSSSISTELAISPFHGHYIYARTMSDGGTTMFAGPFDSGPASELALAQLSSSSYFDLVQGVRVSPPDDSTAAVRLPTMASWELDDPAGAGSMLVWDDTDRWVARCPSSVGAHQAGVLSPDGTHALFSVADASSIHSLGPLQLLTVGSDGPGDCVELSDSNVFWADFSGDGSMIAWIVETDNDFGGQLSIANADGSGTQMVFAGTLLGARFITGTSKLELSYAGDLVWLDVRDPSHKLVYVAEQLFGYATGVAGSWFVGGYDYNTQDALCTLGAIDLDSGKKIQISPSVGQYFVAPQVLPADSDSLSGPTVRTGLYHVVYLVRGRNPSSQDGIWVATVQAADLQ